MNSINKLFFTLLILQLSSIILAKEYKGAEYRTLDTFLYGRFEVSMKPANRVGVISSFFTYREITNTADWNEIDIENIGRYNDMVQFNTITSRQINHLRNHPILFNQYEDFHKYAFEWTPDYIAWFIDGVEVYRQTDEFVQTVNHAQKLMMNIWNPEYSNWVGEWNDYSLPAFAYYDWVSYATYTPGAGNTGTDNNFTSDWRDEFDSFNDTRWAKATHTFQGNKCDFVQENAVIQDGKLILCLTNSANLGYQDLAKPVLAYSKAYSDGTIKLKFSEEIDISIAEITSNYMVPGATVKSADLSNDLTCVQLETDGFDPTVTTNIITLNIKDLSGNTIATAAQTIIPLSYENLPLKINVGGGNVYDYLPNQSWNEELTYGFQDGQEKDWLSSFPITNTEEDSVYLTDGEGTKKYLIRVPDGDYKITLMFAEKYFSEPNKRIFDIIIENELVEENLDIFSKVGKNAAYDIIKTINVTDELIDIILSPKLDQAILSGIKVVPITNSVYGSIHDKYDYQLFQNYPNPFNPTTEISYRINSRSHVKLQVFDLLGNWVTTLEDRIISAGKHTVIFNGEQLGNNLSSGVYFYQLQTEKFIETKKMLFIK